MKIVVTGGAGFIGRHVMNLGLEHGHQMVSFDRAQGDDVLGDLDKIRDAEADVIIHLAGMLGTSELFDEPEAAVAANVVGTLRILGVCKDIEAGFVGITMPDSEWANVYQATKLCAKRLATAWHRTYGIPVSHVRAFNVFGEGQKHGPGHPQKFLPTFATEAWAGRPLPIWGSGDQTVDAIDVRDAARMLVDAASFGGDETFDAGTGHPVSVLGIASYVNGVTRNRAGLDFQCMRDGESMDTRIVARGEGWNLLGWRPQFSWQRLEEVIESYRPDNFFRRGAPPSDWPVDKTTGITFG